jgi:uroporphyrinogen decarboxylase
MHEMTPRQRVCTTLQHQEPDRVPVALGGGPYGIVDTLYLKLVSKLGLSRPVPPFRSGHNISYMDDRLLERLGIDTRYVWPGNSPSSPHRAGQDDSTFIDGYGQEWKRSLPYYYPGTGLLAHAELVNEIETRVNWPDPDDPRWMAGVSRRARMLSEDGRYFVIGRMMTSHGPFQTACNLRGTEAFLMDMAVNPAFAECLLERITQVLGGLLQQYMQAAGAYLDMLELPGDDYAGNSNLVISPAMFRKYIRPRVERLVGIVKTYRPELKVMLHSDGAIRRLLPDLIEMGIDVVHPLEPLPAMDLSAIKMQYGQQLTFLGAIDIVHAMTGTSFDVIQEVKRRIAELGDGGGYILAPSNHLQQDVPAENVIELFEAARKYGKYPLQIERLSS